MSGTAERPESDSGREMARVLIDEMKKELERQKMSFNELSRLTHIPRKRVKKIFTVMHPSEHELRKIAAVMQAAWSDQEGAQLADG